MLSVVVCGRTTEQDRAGSSVPVHYSRVGCDGTESRLVDCSLNGVSGSSLNHNNDVFIVCRPTRVISQSNYSGECRDQQSIQVSMHTHTHTHTHRPSYSWS